MHGLLGAPSEFTQMKTWLEKVKTVFKVTEPSHALPRWLEGESRVEIQSSDFLANVSSATPPATLLSPHHGLVQGHENKAL